MPTRRLLPTDRYAVAVTIGMLLISCTLLPLTADNSYLGISWGLMIAMGATGLIIRRTRLGSAGAAVAQLLVVGLLTVWVAAVWGPAGESVLHRIPSLYGEAADVIRSTTAPMTSSPGITLLFVSSLGMVTLATDQLVITLGRPALSLGPLLAVFGVPTLALGHASIWAFGCLAVSYLAILLAEGLNRASGWGRGLSQDYTQAPRSGTATPTGSFPTGPTVWRGATYLAVPAVVFTLIAAAAIPTFPRSGHWGAGSAGGGGAQHGPIHMSDPTLDLRRNLNRPDDQGVLSYRTDKSSGSYLRMASLSKLTKDGWKNSKTRIKNGKRLPQPPGLTATAGQKRQTKVQIANFDSQYLPLPYAPRRVSARGSWGFDPRSLVVLSSKHGRSAKNATHELSYSVVSREIDPTAEDLRDAGAGSPPDADETTKVPDDLPDKIKKLTKRVTRDASGAADEAAAIQSYFRDGDFTYDLEKLPGSGYTAVENFLFKDQRGYCEQFAGTMALMARVVGIPSRVAVGFLPGTKDGKDWMVSSNDMHAWPELYFSGYGWVRYEPTPSQVTGGAPDWTAGSDDDQEDDPGGPADRDTDNSSSAEPSAPVQHPSQVAAETPEPATPSSSGPPVKRIAGTGAGVVGLLALLATPGTLRGLRRRRRLRGAFAEPADQVEAGWSEIRDTVRDLGHTWPAGSPRSIAGSVQDWLPETAGDSSSAAGHAEAQESAEGSARAAVARLAVFVERGRYAAQFTDAEAAATVPGIVTQIRTGMLTHRSTATRLRSIVLPRSMLHRFR